MKYKFSIIIDESTDIVGTVKNMAICVKYDLENNKLETTFWELVQLFTYPESAKKGATAEMLYNTLLNSFIENKIPMDNIIGKQILFTKQIKSVKVIKIKKMTFLTGTFFSWFYCTIAFFLYDNFK